MRHGKTTALKCLPLATELLIVFLTAEYFRGSSCVAGRPSPCGGFCSLAG